MLLVTQIKIRSIQPRRPASSCKNPTALTVEREARFCRLTEELRPASRTAYGRNPTCKVKSPRPLSRPGLPRPRAPQGAPYTRPKISAKKTRGLPYFVTQRNPHSSETLIIHGQRANGVLAMAGLGLLGRRAEAGLEGYNSATGATDTRWQSLRDGSGTPCHNLAAFRRITSTL